MAWKNFEYTLVGGTPQALATSKAVGKTLIIQPKRANSHVIYVGGSSVSTSNGFELAIPQANQPLDRVAMESGYQSGLDLRSIYVIGTSGEGVQGMYEEF